MGYFGMVRGHPRSSTMSPFHGAHMISYSSLTQALHLSCTAFEIWRVICQNSPTSTYPTCIWHLQGVTPLEFQKDVWRQKTRVSELSYGVVCVILRLAVLVELRLVTNTDRQTQTDTRPWHIPREHSSRGKKAARSGGYYIIGYP